MRRGGLGPDFGWLWRAYTVSAVGSAVGSGALPLVAVLTLHASAFRVSLLTALSAVASAAIALPLGARIERLRKRPVMTAADLVRCAVLLSVPVADACGVLTFAQLCAVGVVQTAAAIAFGAASGAHLKALVAPGDRVRASSSMETANWISVSAGPPVGGLLVGALGATATMAVDALSFLASAAGIRRLRRPEPEPAAPVRGDRSGAGVTAGWRFLLRHPELRALFCNAMLFGGTVMLTSPLMAVLMLRDLGLAPWQYGLALGLPCLGGVLGSRCAPVLTRRLGARRVLLASGVVRTPWVLLLAFVPAGAPGAVAVVGIEFGLLFAAGVFNPTFSARRMELTPDGLMSRVATAWSVTSRTTQAVFMLAGGVAAGLAGVRPTLATAGVLCVAGALLLPWRRAADGEGAVAEKHLSPGEGGAATGRGAGIVPAPGSVPPAEAAPAPPVAAGQAGAAGPAGSSAPATGPDPAPGAAPPGVGA